MLGHVPILVHQSLTTIQMVTGTATASRKNHLGSLKKLNWLVNKSLASTGQTRVNLIYNYNQGETMKELNREGLLNVLGGDTQYYNPDGIEGSINSNGNCYGQPEEPNRINLFEAWPYQY